MINKTYDLEPLHLLLAGTNQKQGRICLLLRGQLRWWFRLLGGFKVLEANYPNVRDQEIQILWDVRKAGRTITKACSQQCKNSRWPPNVMYLTCLMILRQDKYCKRVSLISLRSRRGERKSQSVVAFT